jgi:hypothetical protein
MSSETDTTTAASTGAQETEEQAAVALSHEERTPVAIEHTPPRESRLIALGAGVVGVVLTAPFALLALPFGLAGVVILAGGLYLTHSRGWLSIGTALILSGAVITGAYGAAPTELMLIGVTSTVLAWDVGQHGIGLGEQLGANTHTQRVQFVHTAVSAVVLGSISTVVYLVSLAGSGGRPAPAVAVAVLGIVVVAWLLRS